MAPPAPRHRARTPRPSRGEWALTARVLGVALAGVVIAVFGGPLQSLAAMVLFLVAAPQLLGKTDYAALTRMLGQLLAGLKERGGTAGDGGDPRCRSSDDECRCPDSRWSE